jgi:hypothetical protein
LSTFHSEASLNQFGLFFSYPIIPEFQYSIIPNQDSLPTDAGMARPCSAGMRKDFAEQGRSFLREQAGRLSQTKFY